MLVSCIGSDAESLDIHPMQLNANAFEMMVPLVRIPSEFREVPGLEGPLPETGVKTPAAGFAFSDGTSVLSFSFIGLGGDAADEFARVITTLGEAGERRLDENPYRDGGLCKGAFPELPTPIPCHYEELASPDVGENAQSFRHVEPGVIEFRDVFVRHGVVATVSLITSPDAAILESRLLIVRATDKRIQDLARSLR
jgi:hypothetical protein